MINLNKDNCCGCGVCEKICAHSAITMVADDFGFLYPKVSVDRCVDCGLCERICPFNTKGTTQYDSPKAYAVRHRDPEVVNQSRSGGFFTAITDSILQSGGIIYGAVVDEFVRVVHMRADSSAGRDRMRGSKYSQSQLCDVCNAVKRDLRNGKRVLFSGTPCQVEAITRFVGEKLRENLVTVDIICHGVGSPEVWRRFVEHIERSAGRKIAQVDFRDKKKYGWNGLHKESFLFEKDSVRKYYPYTYYNDFHVRESCRNCPYTSIPRHSDITLGDLWGFEKVVPEWGKGNNGISLVLINSTKGLELMKDSEESIESQPIDLSKVMQPHLQHPIEFDDSCRKKYSEEFRSMPFEVVLEKFHKVKRPAFSRILLNKAKMFLKR